MIGLGTSSRQAAQGGAIVALAVSGRGGDDGTVSLDSWVRRFDAAGVGPAPRLDTDGPDMTERELAAFTAGAVAALRAVPPPTSGRTSPPVCSPTSSPARGPASTGSRSTSSTNGSSPR